MVSGVTDDSVVVVVVVGGGDTVGSGVVGSGTGPASVQPPLPDRASGQFYTRGI